MNISIFDWRDIKAGVAVSFTGYETDCCCYVNAYSLTNWFSWDVSIAISMYNLDASQATDLQRKLAEAVPQLLSIKTLINK